MIVRCVCFALLTATVVSHAEEAVRSTQEELRRRNIFFGDIDGQRSAEYTEAVRRYQKRKGLAASGNEDRDTLRSLGLVSRAPNEPLPKELDWSAGPVLKSDVKLDVGGSAEELAEETGVAAAPLAPTGTGTSQRQRRTRAAARQPAPAPAAKPPSAPRFSLRNRDKIGGEVTKFVADYLRAVGRNNLQDELHFYADRVEYFGQRQVDRRIIEQSLRKYYQQWPKRSYTLQQPVRTQLVPGRAEIVVSYRTSFSLSGGGKKVRGQTDNRVTINAATADPRIVSIEERRVRQ
jgi:peptidoglycan hydrolase-like protein with peptidoglycan-binding domain